ncbi:Anaphase-promoting complex subunit CDC26 [Acropora cervicornis]|uniref:Anaphase-promoting complex subunit CDC26 n=1 Tax=Acropora cervicornis TaxID=6130 RepID=A0AAD9QRS7_ACRCE|nr:Anaphase-promoting complex subunit CDC26 [Acropora cervicornis]
MLRRKPTRIELRGEDIEEYEKVKKLWAKDPKKDEEAAKAQSFLGNDDSPMPLNDPKRILRIHERIGYKPDTVPSDGTVTFLS